MKRDLVRYLFIMAVVFINAKIINVSFVGYGTVPASLCLMSISMYAIGIASGLICSEPENKEV